MKNKVYYDDVNGSIGYLNPLFRTVKDGQENDEMVVTVPGETMGNQTIGGMVTYNGGAASQTVCTISELSVITGVHAFCLDTFTGGSETINIGLDGGAASGFLADAHITKIRGAVSGDVCANRGALLWDVASTSPIQALVCTETDVIATVTNLATAGALGVLFQCIPLGDAFAEYFS
jgi:hypothetical protein